MVMKMYIEGKKIIKVMHQNCITPKAYKEICDANNAMDLIISSARYERMEEEWMENHTELFDEDGDCPQEALNQMADECASAAWGEFEKNELYDCGDFTLYIIDEDADMYELPR